MALEQCPFNSGVDCPPHDRECGRCGWLPAVTQVRKATIGRGPIPSVCPKKSAGQKWRRILKVDDRGNVVAEYSSIGAAVKATSMTRAALLYRCDGLKVKADPDGCTYRYAD